MKKNITLTEKQHTVLELIAKGLSDNEIANSLGCTVANIRSISDRIVYKFQANNRPNLVYKAFKKGLIK